MASTTAVSRILSGNHSVSDVIAGAAIGTLWGFAILFVGLELGEKN